MEYRPGVWTMVPEAQALANEECRKNRGLDISLEYHCSVSERSLCTYADQMRNVKIEYFCWEIGEQKLFLGSNGVEYRYLLGLTAAKREKFAKVKQSTSKFRLSFSLFLV